MPTPVHLFIFPWEMDASDKLLNKAFIRYLVVGTVTSKWGHFPVSYLSWEVKAHNFPFGVFNREWATNLWSVWGVWVRGHCWKGGWTRSRQCLRNPCHCFIGKFAVLVIGTQRGEEIIHCPFCHGGWCTGALGLCRLMRRLGLVPHERIRVLSSWGRALAALFRS